MIRISRRALPAQVAIVVLAPAGSSLTACGGGSGSAHGTTQASAAASEHEGVPGFGHVFLIVGENTSANQVTAARAPYLTSSIKPRAAWLTHYFALTDGSLGNYVAMVSGQFIRCEANNDFSFTNGDVRGQHACHQNVDNLFHQLDRAGVSWQQWNESAATPCDMFDHGTTWSKHSYVSHHSPALYFDDIQAHHSSEDVVPSAECRNKMLPAGTTAPNDMSTYNAALASGNVARFNLVVPNNCENGHDLCGGTSSLGQFDSFLSREIPKVEASPAFGSNGTIIVTWDEGSDPPLNPKHVVTAVIGPSVKPGVYGGGPFNHYSLLRTLEDGFGIPQHLAHAARAHAFADIWR